MIISSCLIFSPRGMRDLFVLHKTLSNFLVCKNIILIFCFAWLKCLAMLLLVTFSPAPFASAPPNSYQVYSLLCMSLNMYFLIILNLVPDLLSIAEKLNKALLEWDKGIFLKFPFLLFLEGVEKSWEEIHWCSEIPSFLYVSLIYTHAMNLPIKKSS